jgi:predicted cupin superfamily sugar epimerase
VTRAQTIIRRLGLKPHPEGGHYRETFRDAAGENGRAHSTAIYFLLAKGERSAWHRIDAAEIWHWYGGAPLVLSIARDGVVEERVLGPDLSKKQVPQIVVPAGAWQSAWPRGSYSFVGCTVAPGFLFETFELATPAFSPDASNAQAPTKSSKRVQSRAKTRVR